MLYEILKKTLAGNPVYEALRAVRVARRAERIAAFNRLPYQRQSALRAIERFPVKGKRVLVVGAADGMDCQPFVAAAAREVCGLDIQENIGSAFQHRRVRYHRNSIESTDLPDDTFDLVFSVATLEHVPDIEAAFKEMARLTAPAGGVYCHAAPLWESPYGHHMTCFEGHPWVHLVFSPDELLAYAEQKQIIGERGHSIQGLTRYIHTPGFFNRRPAEDYARAALSTRLIVERNDFMMSNADMLSHPLGMAAIARGYSEKSLLAVSHTLVATKPV